MPQSMRWRLDAVVMILFLFGGVLAVAVLSCAFFSADGNLLGKAGESLARSVIEPLGWAVFTFLLAWFLLTFRLTVDRRLSSLVRRLVGWTILTLDTAWAADGLNESIPSPVAAGPGGTIGAYLRFVAEDGITPFLQGVTFAATLIGGLWLVADRLVVLLLRWLFRLIREFWRLLVKANDAIADVNERILRGVARLILFTLRPLRRLLRGTSDAKALISSSSRQGANSVSGDHRGVTEGADEIPITHPTTLVDQGGLSVSRPMLKAFLCDDEASHNGQTHSSEGDYQLPPLSLLNDPDPFPVADHEQKLREVAALLEKTFQDFGLNVKVVGIHTGPVITQYEIALETGLRLSKVTNLADDLALNLRVPSVRVVAPLPGRNTVGIEVPNEIRQVVRLKELIAGTSVKAAKFKLPIFLGNDVEGRPLAYDLASMPHLLIAGRTGTGKSVCLNVIILSLLFTKRPDECRMILIDPKKVELTEYATIPHLMTPVVKDDKKSEAILAWAVDKMEERYEWLHRARVRNIASYNELPFDEILRRINPDSEEERKAIPRKMPYIVIVIDEVADLIMKMKKEIEGNIILLAQKSRAAGIHLILATQKPTVDVVTGLIKSNLPARICFQVASRSDSAVVLDEKGAEKLLGQGDMLFLQPGTSTIVRAQGAYVDDKEIERVVNALATDQPNYDSELLNLKTKDQVEGGNATATRLRERDPLYEQAVEIVVREQRGSTSLLQRALGIGYGKASRFIDFMAEDGIVGGYNGSNARDVLISYEEWTARREAG